MKKSRLGYGFLLILWVGVSWGCAGAPPCQTSETVALPATQAAPSVTPPSSVLQQKVTAQEKRIAELSMQLNLLKRIDQDRKKDR